jgi:hypothetical protein
MSAAFVEVWGKQDPASALSWCEENLSGLSLNNAVAGVVKGTAQKDLAAAAALVTAMEPSSARAEAAVAISRKMFPDSFSNKTTATRKRSPGWRNWTPRQCGGSLAKSHGVGPVPIQKAWPLS